MNLGISAEDSFDLSDRIKNEISARTTKKPKYKKQNLIIIQVGKNDSNFIKSKQENIVPLKNFKKNIKKIIKISKKFADNVLFISPSYIDESKTNPLNWAKDNFCKNEIIEKYVLAIQEVCKKKDIYFLNLFEEFQKLNYKKLLYDGLHPNIEGHKKIWKIVKAFLLKNNILTGIK